MVGAGMTPGQPIRTATAGNADLLGLAHGIGTLEEGKQALNPPGRPAGAETRGRPP
jgi:hypothetical protein